MGRVSQSLSNTQYPVPSGWRALATVPVGPDAASGTNPIPKLRKGTKKQTITAQRGCASCPRSHSQKGGVRVQIPGSLTPQLPLSFIYF